MNTHLKTVTPLGSSPTEQIQSAQQCFRQLLDKSSPSERYSYLIEGLETLIGLGSSSLLPDNLKRQYIQLATEGFGLMFATWAQNHLMIQVLSIARELSISIGDYRSKAICDFQLSALLLHLNELEKSENAYQQGLEVVHELDDKEISDIGYMYSIVYHVIRGQPNKVLEAYSISLTMLHQLSNEPFVMSFIIPMTALAAAFTGRFRLGVRLLIRSRQAAQADGAAAVDLALQALLGWLLTASGDTAQARYHIEAAMEAPEGKHLPLSRYWAERSMAYLLYKEGDLHASYERMQSAHSMRYNSLYDRPSFSYHVPWVLEMLQAFHIEGFDPIPQLNYESEIERQINGHNLHLKGVALRLLAVDARRKDVPAIEIFKHLKASRDYLKESGGIIELAKTLLEIGRTHIQNDDIKRAKPYISKAWQIYSNTAPNLFPENMHHFIDLQLPAPEQGPFWPGHKRLMDLFDNLDFSGSSKELYQQLVALTCHFFSAERGALFILDEQTGTLILENAYNFSGFNPSSPRARWLLSVADKSLKENQPMLEDWIEEGSQRRSALCIPFQACDKNHVLYVGTSYRHIIQKYPQAELLLLSDHIGLLLRLIINKLMSLEKSHKKTLGQLTIAKESRDNSILYTGKTMGQLLENASTAARLDVPVLILGETGVGKELLAQFIHEQSLRNSMPFVTVDLSCTTESLIESELFGHERGAFTGAEKQRIGSIELADEGTLFIDEIGEIPLSIQVKLLRVLQEKTFKRLGGMRTHRSDFRLIAATNRDLKQDVQIKRFREDLYYRLNVVPLVIPPLRHRSEDIAYLAQNFLENFSHKHDLPNLTLDAIQELCLRTYKWPGNVRELKNLMERVVVMQDATLIQKVLPKYVEPMEKTLPPAMPSNVITIDNDRFPTLDEIQATYIKHVLHYTNGKIAGKNGAAHLLGMNRSTLYNRIKKLGITLSP